MTETVGEVIRDWRTNHRFISQSRAAELAGVDTSLWVRWESGERKPTHPALKRLHSLIDDAGFRARLLAASDYSMIDSDESFGNVFADIRQKYAVSSVLLGARTGISRGNFYKWEAGQRVPRKATLDRVCEVINPSLEDTIRLYRAAGYEGDDMETMSTTGMDFLMSHLKTVQAMVTMIAPEAVSNMQEAMHKADTPGTALDPTLYRERMSVHQLNTECVDAFAAYHKRLLEIAEKAGKE